jgi:hemolysin activation/secretion protein
MAVSENQCALKWGQGFGASGKVTVRGHGMSRLAALLALVAVAAAALPAQAQIPPNAGSILQQPAPRVEPTEPRPVLPRITPLPEPTVSSDVKVTVKWFKFTGNSQMSSDLLSTQLAAYTNRELDLAGLRAATERVRDYYRGAGYFLAQAYLPRQEIVDGVVEVAIVEGRLGTLSVKREPGLRIRESFIRGILDAHVAPGSLLVESTLERPLLILDGLPSSRASAALVPGASSGAADIEVEVRPTSPGWLEGITNGALSGSVDLDNHGNRFTGEYRIGVTMQAISLTGYGDLLTARFQKANQSETQLSRLNWATPVGHYGTTFGIGYTRFDYGLGKDFAPLLADGDGRTGNVYLSHPLIRTRPLNLYGRVGYEYKSLEDRIGSTGLVDTRTVRLGYISLQMDARDRTGLSAAGLTWNHGNVSLDTPGILAFDQGAGGFGVNGSFSRTNIELQRLQRLAGGFSLYGVLSGQFASKNLSSSEKFSLGGPNAVRAYPVGESTGDEGYLATAELRYSSSGLKLGSGMVGLSLFYDFGHINTSKDGPNGGGLLNNSRSIAGAGIGASLGAEGNYLLRASVAWPTTGGNPRSDPADRNPRIWIQAIQWF